MQILLVLLQMMYDVRAIEHVRKVSFAHIQIKIQELSQTMNVDACDMLVVEMVVAEAHLGSHTIILIFLYTHQLPRGFPHILDYFPIDDNQNQNIYYSSSSQSLDKLKRSPDR